MSIVEWLALIDSLDSLDLVGYCHYMNNDDQSGLEFPVRCHFRVIAENIQNMHFVIETVLMELGVKDAVEPANSSAGGKYISFNISTVVESREQMDRIDNELRLIKGVKMVL